MDRCPLNGQSSAVSQLWGSKASSAYPHQRESVYPGTGHCCRWKLGKPKLQQAQWRYHSASKHPLPIIGALPPTRSTVTSARHTWFHFLCPKFPIWICLVGMLLDPCRFPWMACCFPKRPLAKRIASCWLFNVLIASIGICNRHVVICVPSSASFSSPSWGVSVVCNSRLNLNQKQGPSSANHTPFHLPSRKN